MNVSMFALLIGIPLVSSPVVYLFGRLTSRAEVLNRQGWIVRALALLAVTATWWPFVNLWLEFQAGGKRLFTNVESIWIQLDGLTFLLAAMVLTLGTLAILFSGRYMAGEIGEEKYYAMLLAMIGLMIGLGCANDLFNLWVWFEAMAVSSYLLVAFYREQPGSLEAGMKYVVQSAVGSVLALLGVALVLAQTGTLDMDQIQLMVGTMKLNHLGLLAAGALFFIGFGVKVAMVPLHTWLPDAHSQAPSGISAMLSGVVIEAGLVAMLRALSTLTGFALSWGWLLLGFGALNMLYGNLLALQQVQVKRMLAFSSLSHIGYILMGLGIALVSGQAAGAQGASFHLFTHMLMKGLAFLAVGAAMYALFHEQGIHRPLVAHDLNGISTRYPWVALSLSIALLALGGLPPLAGFMSKWQIFVAGFQSGNGWLMGFVVFAALNSVLSLAYYAPLVNRMYRCVSATSVKKGSAAISWTLQLPLLLLALAVVVLGLFPSLMNWLTEPAGAALMSIFK
ncbi:MAG: NADH dehydrogenase [Chloroflexi bacterium]|nr:NADH dehydrogenase [Chloroflexota bacterium]